MTAYDLVKFLHVSAAIVWVGGGLGLFVLNQRFARAEDYAGLGAAGRQMDALSRVFFMPAAIATLAFGIWLVAISDGFAFTDLWIVLGFAAIVVSVVNGIVLVRPAGKRMGEAFATHGPGSAEVNAAFRLLTRLNVVNLLVLFFAVWTMVAKPTL